LERYGTVDRCKARAVTESPTSSHGGKGESLTSRERIVAAARGGEVDRRPTLSWLSESSSSDAAVLEQTEIAKSLSGERVVLANVPNPFGLALGKGIDLNKALKDDPSVGGVVLDGLVEEVRSQIRASLESGADGIFYRLHGANPSHCTPMEYGGHYLERDRELLNEADGATFNVLFIAGNEELYIDFVSDLPAHAFAWDYDLSKLPASEVRQSRIGAVASSDPSSEILLEIGNDQYLETLEQPNIG